jgi:hypothetical protein
MLELITDIIRAGVGWREVSKRDREIASEVQAHEDRLAPLFAAAAGDPLRFRRLLEQLTPPEAKDLHRRLCLRVIHFGTCFSRRDIEAKDTIRWARDEVGRLYPDYPGNEDHIGHDGENQAAKTP